MDEGGTRNTGKQEEPAQHECLHAVDFLRTVNEITVSGSNQGVNGDAAVDETVLRKQWQSRISNAPVKYLVYTDMEASTYHSVQQTLREKRREVLVGCIVKHVYVSTYRRGSETARGQRRTQFDAVAPCRGNRKKV